MVRSARARGRRVPNERSFSKWRDGTYPYTNMVVEVVAILSSGKVKLRAVERSDGDDMLIIDLVTLRANVAGRGWVEVRSYCLKYLGIPTAVSYSFRMRILLF